MMRTLASPEPRSIPRIGHRLRALLHAEGAIQLLSLMAIVALGVVLRADLMSTPMYIDESITYNRYVSKPLLDAISKDYWPNNHIFYTILAQLSTTLFGNSPWATRLPVFLSGSLLILAGYMVARRLYDRQAALLAAGLIASLNPLLLFSVNGRGYILLCLLFLTLIWVGSYLQDHCDRRGWSALIVLSALGFYTLPTMLYGFGMIVVWLLLATRREGAYPRRLFLRHLALSTVLAGLLTTLLYLPVVLGSGLKSIIDNQWVRPDSWDFFVTRFPLMLRKLYAEWQLHVPVLIRYGLIAGLSVAVLFHRRIARYRGNLVLAATLWLVPLVLLQHVVGFTRNWLFLLPLLAVMAAGGISASLRPLLRDEYYLSWTMALAALGFTLVVGHRGAEYRPVNDVGTLDQGEQIALYLKPHLRPGDRVVTSCDAAPTLNYYFKLQGIPDGYVQNNARSASRFLVVSKQPGFICKGKVETMEAFLDERGLRPPVYSAPVALRQFTYATVYELRRVEP